MGIFGSLRGSKIEPSGRLGSLQNRSGESIVFNRKQQAGYPGFGHPVKKT